MLWSKLVKNKKGFDMPFSWIFAIIAGVIILLLAIYITTKFIDTGKYQTYTETAKKITLVFDSMKTSSEESKTSSIEFRKETKTYYDCSLTGKSFFGKNTISFSEGGGGGEEIPIYDGYIFADDIEQGKELYLFSKSFYMPFKVDDLIFVSSENYCFKEPPEEIKEEIEDLNMKNIKIDYCDEGDVEICFSGNCEIGVNCLDYSCENGYVKKGGEILYFSGNLIYGAIFSSPKNYECNFKRLGVRISQLSEIYIDKIKIIQKTGCGLEMESDLKLLGSETASIETSENIAEIFQLAKIIGDKNENAGKCKVW